MAINSKRDIRAVATEHTDKNAGPAKLGVCCTPTLLSATIATKQEFLSYTLTDIGVLASDSALYINEL